MKARSDSLFSKLKPAQREELLTLMVEQGAGLKDGQDLLVKWGQRASYARLDAWISSRDDIQARLFLEDCKSFANLLNLAASDLGEKVIDDDGHSAYVLQFSNSLRAHSMSSNPDAQAGKRGDRVLDEFALHPDPRKLYSIAYPGITWGGSLEIFSTHRGSANFFNGLINEIRHKGNPKGFSLHRVTLQDALDQGFLYKLQGKLPPDDERQGMDEAAYFDFIKAGCADEESFAQEYMCQPSDDAAAFLSYELIDGCKYGPTEDWESDLLDCKNPLFVGVDIGRTGDLTVIWVIERVGGISLTRRVIELKNTPFAAQEAELYPILELPQVRRCCIDQTGIGRQFSYVDSDLDIPALQHQIPPETRLDSKCGDLLRRALKYAPTVVYWWEGTQIRFADADKTTADKTLSDTLYSLSQASLNARYDLLHDKVKVYWLKDKTLVRTDETASTGDAAVLGANRTFVQTFEVGAYNIPASGIAAALLKHVSRLHIDASAEQLALDWTLRPGQLWAYSGLLASTYKSFCWQISRDLFRGAQTLSLGVPPSLGIYSLSAGNNDTPPDPDPSAGGHPFQGVDVSIGGSKIIRVIYGTISGEAPDGMSLGDVPAYTLSASGSQSVFVGVSISTSTGEITSRWIDQAASLPADTDSNFYLELFSYSIDAGILSISQSVAGSVSFQACPWFYSSPRSYLPNWGMI